MDILGKQERPVGDSDHWASAGGITTPGATRMVERLLDIGIDGRGSFDSARAVASTALAEHTDVESAIDAMVRSHLRLSAVNGFLTGLAGFVTLPIALPANVVGFYLVATRLVAGIASTRGHDIDRPEVRSAILLALVGADADDLLRKASEAGTGRLANLVAQRLPGPALMAARKGFTFRLLSQAGRRSVAGFGRAVPLVGGVVGAGLDTYQLRRIADHARLEFVLKPSSVTDQL